MLPSDPAPPSSPRPIRAIEGLIGAAWDWGWLTALILLAPGLALWTLLHAELRGFVMRNNLARTDRYELLATMLAGACAMGLGYAAYAVRRRASGDDFAAAARRVNHYAFVLAIAPLLAALTFHGIETKHALTTLTIIGLCSAVFGVFAYRVAGAFEPWLAAASDRGSARAHRLAWLAVGAVGVAYAGYFSWLSILDHWNFGTAVYDLGIYDNIVWRTGHGDFLGCSYCRGGAHTSSHFDPILLLVVPFHLCFPRAETLLVFQSAWLASGVVPLYLLARRRLGRPWLAVLLPVTYVLYPALHGANMFDFHSLALITPLVPWAIFLIDGGGARAYTLVLVLILMVREDMAFLACGLGLYAVAIRRTALGLSTIGAALVYLAWVKIYWMASPGIFMHDQGAISYASFYSQMIPYPGEGLGGLVLSFLTNPAFVIKMLLANGKLSFFCALLLPLVFLPLAAGRKLLTMLYGFVFLGLATREFVYSLNFQYATVLFPALFAAVPDAIERLTKGRLARAWELSPERVPVALLWTCLFACALTGYKFGGISDNTAFRAGWSPVDRHPSAASTERRGKVHALIAKIPPERAVSTTTSIAPHVSSRRNAYRFPKVRDAEWVLVHRNDLDARARKVLTELLADGELRLVDAVERHALYERRSVTSARARGRLE